MPENYFHLGNKLIGERNFQGAVNAYKAALSKKENFPEAYNNMGVALQRLGNLREAEISYKRAILLNINYSEAYNNYGNLLEKSGNYKDSFHMYSSAININPNYYEAIFNIGNVCKHLRDYDLAINFYGRALNVNPRYVEAWNNLGEVSLKVGKPFDAIEYYIKAIGINPNHLKAKWNLSLALILTGDYNRGWAMYETRLILDDLNIGRSYNNKKIWTGGRLSEKDRLFIYSEQGLGDFIQFFRYIAMIDHIPEKVFIEVPESLYHIIRSTNDNVQMVTKLENFDNFDYYCAIGSMPSIYGTDLDEVPTSIPYLTVDQQRFCYWQSKLGLKTSPRVGLVWSGSATHNNDHNRSIRLDKFINLLQNTNFEFHSLQKEYRSHDADFLRGSCFIIDHSDSIQDFSDTAAIIESMDIVISVDTSVAHLAGAMGKPVWILLPFAPDYRWLLERDDSPWYPTARLFRQPKANDWESVLNAVISYLEDTF